MAIMLVTQGLEDIVVSDDPVFTAEYSIPTGVGYDFYAWQERSLLGIQVKSTSSIEKKKNIRRTLSQYEKDLQSMYAMQEHIHNVRVQSIKSTQSMIVHNLAHTSGFSRVDCMNRARMESKFMVQKNYRTSSKVFSRNDAYASRITETGNDYSVNRVPVVTSFVPVSRYVHGAY